MRGKWVFVCIFTLLISTLWTAATVMGQEAKTEEKIFSGQTSEYRDDHNGYKFRLPVEFKLNEKGATTDWVGPLIDGMAASVSVNVTEMPDVPESVMYDVNLKSKKKDSRYTNVVPLKVKIGSKTALGFRCIEANNVYGTSDLKAPSDIHRWHLYVFANRREYLMGMSTAFSVYQAKKIQPVYEEIIKSFEIIPIDKKK